MKNKHDSVSKVVLWGNASDIKVFKTALPGYAYDFSCPDSFAYVINDESFDIWDCPNLTQHPFLLKEYMQGVRGVISFNLRQTEKELMGNYSACLFCEYKKNDRQPQDLLNAIAQNTLDIDTPKRLKTTAIYLLGIGFFPGNQDITRKITADLVEVTLQNVSPMTKHFFLSNKDAKQEGEEKVCCVHPHECK